MIVLDEDRDKPIHIRQSVTTALFLVCGTSFVAICLALAAAGGISRIGVHAFVSRAIQPTGADLLGALILAFFVALPFVLIRTRYTLWRVEVIEGQIHYRSLFGRRVIGIGDIGRVTSGRGREDFYKLFLKDGTSIAMHAVAGGSLTDLARFEDEIVCRAPQVEMKRRLFGKIVKRGYTEFH